MDSVSAFLSDATTLAKTLPMGLPKAQIDIMWQMGVASFTTNGNELVIPQFMAVKLSQDNIGDLKSRMSGHFDNALVEEYFDQSAKVLRIRRAPELPAFAGDTAMGGSMEPRDATHQSLMSAPSPVEVYGAEQTSGSEKGAAKKLRQPDKKSKVSRPPNAFILYRKQHHPILLKTRPNLPNCEISKVLGKQWHSEPQEVRTKWTALADKIKVQHALENPGYQYAPRKPSEKKRRMTPRKLAKLHDSQADSDVEMIDMAEFEQFLPDRVAANRSPEIFMTCNIDAPHSTTALLCNERTSAYPSRFKKNYNTDDMSTFFPAGHDTVEHDYNIRAALYSPRAPSERLTFSSGPYSDVRTFLAASTLAADQFMNGLIDWDGIAADAQTVHDAVQQSNLETLEFDTDAERAQFQDEMDRVLAMFE